MQPDGMRIFCLSAGPAEGARLRLLAATTAPDRVDRTAGDAGVIYGVSLMTAGECKGHGVLADAKTVTGIVTLAAGRELKSRFTHPGMCSDGTGKMLGHIKNVRASADGKQALGDLWLSKSATKAPGQGDLAGYVLDLAQQHPKDFGLSVVVASRAVWVMTDGSEMIARSGDKKPEGAASAQPVLRPVTLMACDVVDEPAANPAGLFHSTEITTALSALSDFGSGPALEAFDALDWWASKLGADKIAAVFTAWQARRPGAACPPSGAAAAPAALASPPLSPPAPSAAAAAGAPVNIAFLNSLSAHLPPTALPTLLNAAAQAGASEASLMELAVKLASEGSKKAIEAEQAKSAELQTKLTASQAEITTLKAKFDRLQGVATGAPALGSDAGSQPPASGKTLSLGDEAGLKAAFAANSKLAGEFILGGAEALVGLAKTQPAKARELLLRHGFSLN